MQSWRRPTQGLCLRCALRVPTSLSRSFSEFAHLNRPRIRTFRVGPGPLDLEWLENGTKKESNNGIKSGSHNAKLGKANGPKVRKVNERTFDERFHVALSEISQTIRQRLEQTESELASWDRFYAPIAKICDESTFFEVGDANQLKQKFTLRQTFGSAGFNALTRHVETLYRDYKLDEQFPLSLAGQDALTDMRFPSEWYPVARSLQRKVHLHVGPTNSGKTYHALQRLEKAKSGFYGGPLRLLAHEIYSRLNKKGISCALVTGDEVKVPEGEAVRIFSNTVEMVPVGLEMDVGVIDEIQMIADPSRGWAWTRAVLGCQVKELHLCGEERAVPLIRQLVSLMGDTLEIHNYKRLNPLKTMKTSLKGDIKRLEKGDCVVSFSRVGIHSLKQEIEKVTGRRAAIVYGSLPAEIRAQQADLFNDPDNDYDFLVASDAIGMGLNLSIKRIIFESVTKRSPAGIRQLTVSEVKQIGGRAGRYRPANASSNSSNITASKGHKNENVGYVTCLDETDLPYVQAAMKTEAQPLDAAGILPLDFMTENFSNMFPPGTPFGYIYQRLQRVARTNPPFFMCHLKERDATLGLIDNVQGLTVADKMIFVCAPLRPTDSVMAKAIKAFAACVGQNKSGRLLDIPELDLDILDKPVSGDDKGYLRSLEALHRSIILYLWLGYRFGGVFTDRTLATHAKEIVEVKMHRALTEFSANSKLQKRAIRQRRQRAAKQQFILDTAEATGVTDTISDTPELEDTLSLQYELGAEQPDSSSGKLDIDSPMDTHQRVMTSVS
ncbi:hypothetical protein FQN49_005663 [Arthroderma sp. PD_2]|nr:hypothetical protein FQN49_005663 [Arthroderma sp. PD_2]